MEEFEIKRGLSKNIEGEKLGHLMERVFGNVRREDDWYVSEYGAMSPIRTRMASSSALMVDINTISIPEDEVMDTIRRRNTFLEEATGFNAKQRLKRLKDKAKKGQL